MIADTSLLAYREIASKLSAKQRAVLEKALEVFGPDHFTRKRLARALGWEINRVTGRVLELIKLQQFEECGTVVEDGRAAHLLRIRSWPAPDEPVVPRKRPRSHDPLNLLNQLRLF